MGFFARVFGKQPEPQRDPEHAVLLHFRLESTWPSTQEVDRYHALEERLEEAVKDARAGELDGDEFGEGECVVFLYGPDAEALWKAVMPVLEKEPFPKGSFAIKRFGGPDCGQEERINLAWEG